MLDKYRRVCLTVPFVDFPVCFRILWAVVFHLVPLWSHRDGCEFVSGTDRTHPQLSLNVVRGEV